MATISPALVAARSEPPARLLYLAGEDRSGDLAGALRAKNFVVDTAWFIAWSRRKAPGSSGRGAGRQVDGVLHFSRRSAEAYLTAARQTGLLEAALEKPAHFCLSARIAEPLTAAGAANVRIAAQPDEAALRGIMRLNHVIMPHLLGFVRHVAATAAAYYAVPWGWLRTSIR